MNALEIKDLSKSFGSFSLQNLTLTVPMGTALGLIGENGAGKSTTISLILGQLRRDSGEKITDAFMQFILYIFANIHSTLNRHCSYPAAACIKCIPPLKYRTKTNTVRPAISEYATKSKNIQEKP